MNDPRNFGSFVVRTLGEDPPPGFTRRTPARQAPYRAITSRSVRKERGPTGRIYTDETLECGHSYQTDATGAARDKAKRRRCVKCLDEVR
jgi:hypothetical protein